LLPLTGVSQYFMGPGQYNPGKFFINLTRLPLKDKPHKDCTGVNLPGAITRFALGKKPGYNSTK
jgi:hypothetical protein